MRCDGKERFLTFALAERMAKKSSRRHDKTLRLHAYRCECGGYHVGSSVGTRGSRPRQSFRVLEEEYA